MFTKSKFKRELHALTSNEEALPKKEDFIKMVEASFSAKKCEVILKHIFKKLQEESSKYRKIEKTFHLIYMLLEGGSKKIIFELKNKIFLIQNLRQFSYIVKKKNVGESGQLSSSGDGY